MPEELSPSQAAARVGATTRSVQRWITSGQLPARRVGGRWRVATDAIDAFVAAARSPAGQSSDAWPPSETPPSSSGPRPIPIRTLFIANRGEIARRITRTATRLGIRAVVPETDGPNALDLLDARAVVAAAIGADADALHPGFGFLAENADFADAVDAAGIRWIGPPASAIRAMGDKAAARRLAASLGVPILPGYDDADQSDEALIAAAGRVGFPLLVKPAAGGGGKGMRTVRGAEALPDAIAAARREAAASFGDDALILERLVVGARHVEIQVLFDEHGTGIHLGERDCSIQRRHQKILEETPSPAVDAVLRERLGEAALTLARAVGYVSAGTCEFLLDTRSGPTFLEMNTRLQVEHPVTEAVTGRDLVEDQLRIAAGERLGVAVQVGTVDGIETDAHRGHAGRNDHAAAGAAPVLTVPTHGHAIEVRLYAEDAEHEFLPATGRVESLRWPTGEGVRVDAGIDVGTEIGGRFDPMLAKIIAWGPDRAAALARLTSALDETVVLGVVTNLRFLRWLVRQPVVVAGEARTDVLHRIWPPEGWAADTAIPEEAWQAAAAALIDGGGEGPWAGGWRLNAPASLLLTTEDETRRVELSRGAAPALATVPVGDTVHLDLAGRSVGFRLAPPPDVDAASRAAIAHGVAGSTGATAVLAPMPGAVLTIHVKVGDVVAAGDPVVTLEAMKMEHVVPAPAGGRVVDIGVRPADQVTRGQSVAVVDPETASSPEKTGREKTASSTLTPS